MNEKSIIPNCSYNQCQKISTLLTLNVIQGHEMKHKHQQSAFLAINNPSSKPLLLALKRNRLNHILNLPQITLVL